MSSHRTLRLYAELVLNILRSHGGTAEAKVVRHEIADRLSPDTHPFELNRSQRPKFEVNLGWTKLALQRAGYLHSANRGVWVLSDLGLRTFQLTDEELIAITKQRHRDASKNVDLLRRDAGDAVWDDLLLAAEYAKRIELGVKPQFPLSLVIRLLSSQEEERRDAGLYLLTDMKLGQIAPGLIATPTCYSALALRILADAIHTTKSEQRDSSEDGIRQTLGNWQLSPELVEIVVSQYKNVMGTAGPSGLQSASQHESKKRLALIVHGTWAAPKLWWRPNVGAFWNFIKPHWPHLYDGATPFSWSGANSHAARVAAAKQLIAWCKAQNASSIDVIAHSHGGNVCLLAARGGLDIDRLVLLGTPIRTEYMVDLDRVRSIRNVFSLGDHIQTPLGSFPNTRFEGRTLGDSAAVSNWRCEDNGLGSEPDHGALHEVPTWTASSLLSLLA